MSNDITAAVQKVIREAKTGEASGEQGISEILDEGELINLKTQGVPPCDFRRLPRARQPASMVGWVG